MADKKQDAAVASVDPVELAGMSEERFNQYLRLECLKLTEFNGRINSKAITALPPEAEILFSYVKTGSLAKQ